MVLEDTKTESLNAAFQKIQKSLYLRENIHVFDSLRNFDALFNDEDESGS
jgi:hypothetical protein